MSTTSTLSNSGSSTTDAPTATTVDAGDDATYERSLAIAEAFGPVQIAILYCPDSFSFDLPSQPRPTALGGEGRVLRFGDSLVCRGLRLGSFAPQSAAMKHHLQCAFMAGDTAAVHSHVRAYLTHRATRIREVVRLQPSARVFICPFWADVAAIYRHYIAESPRIVRIRPNASFTRRHCQLASATVIRSVEGAELAGLLADYRSEAPAGGDSPFWEREMREQDVFVDRIDEAYGFARELELNRPGKVTPRLLRAVGIWNVK